MLGEKIAEATGRVTGQRVLPNDGTGPRMETSFQATGKLLGVNVSETGTYWAVVRPDGTLYGEGQGVVMGKNGEAATWVGSGVGTMKKNGSVSYRGAVYYSTATRRWARLGRIAVVFEFEVDPQGTSKAQLWEWK
jgi:hypothetical protein